MDRSEVIVVAATAAEAAHVPTDLRTVICGIGKVDAAAAVTEAVLTHPGPGRPTVINIGTAGALRPGVAGLYRPSAVRNHDISAAELRALQYPLVDRIDLPGGDGSELATGDVFVTDPAVRDRLAESAHLVDMEGFAVARACRRLQAQCLLIKHISDDADDRAMEWLERVDASARVLGDWLRAHLN